MLHLLLVLVPLGLAAAVSPVMATEQAVVLTGPKGPRSALLYAAGTASVLVVVVGAVQVVGRSLTLPTAPHLDASLDLLIGGLLVAVAAVLRLRRPGDRGEDRRLHDQISPARAFTFGVVSMATNLTTLALVVPAAKEIAASAVAAWEALVAASVLVALACLPAWGPVALDAAAPQTAGRLLDRLAHLLRRHGRLLAALLIGAVGVCLLTRGVLRLAQV